VILFVPSGTLPSDNPGCQIYSESFGAKARVLKGFEQETENNPNMALFPKIWSCKKKPRSKKEYLFFQDLGEKSHTGVMG